MEPWDPKAVIGVVALLVILVLFFPEWQEAYFELKQRLGKKVRPPRVRIKLR